MSGLEITCINRDTRGLIGRIGGEGWSFSLHEAIVKLISHQLGLTIKVEGEYFQVGVHGEGFDAYLVRESDGFPLHRLNFPSC